MPREKRQRLGIVPMNVEGMHNNIESDVHFRDERSGVADWFGLYDKSAGRHRPGERGQEQSTFCLRLELR